MRDKIASGKKGLDDDLLLAELELGSLTFAEASERRTALKKVSRKMARRIDELILNLEVMELLKEAGRDAEKVAAAGVRFYAMVQDGHVATESATYGFWRGAMAHAEELGDIKTFERGYKALKEHFQGNSRANRMLKAYADTLDEMKKG